VLPPDRVGAKYAVAFDNRTAGRMWFFDRYSTFTGRGYGMSVSQLDARRREVSRLVAAQAWYDRRRGGWEFRDGRELAFDVDRGELMSTVPFTEKFEPSFHEDPNLMLLTTARAIDLSFFELKRLVDYFAVANRAEGVPYAVRYYGLIADTLGPLIVIAITIPFAVSGVRVNPVVGVSKSIGLFFLYYVVMNVAAILAAKEVIDPQLAAWLPNLGMGGLAVWFFAKLR
jgi:lipopolysaccharide export system permease protein